MYKISFVERNAMKLQLKRKEEKIMGFKTKRTIMMILAGVVVTVIYIMVALGAKAPASTDLRAWAILILKFIGIGVAATIALQIIFHVAYSVGVSVKEGIKKEISGEKLDDKEIERQINATVMEDEMDKVIETKASRVGSTCFGMGFIVALCVVAGGLPILWALHIQLAAMVAGALIEGVVSVILYERGV